MNKPGWCGEDIQGYKYIWTSEKGLRHRATQHHRHTANDLRWPADGPATPPGHRQRYCFRGTECQPGDPGCHHRRPTMKGMQGSSNSLGNRLTIAPQVAPNTPRCSTDGLIDSQLTRAVDSSAGCAASEGLSD